jgi:hypothetical protein
VLLKTKKKRKQKESRLFLSATRMYLKKRVSSFLHLNFYDQNNIEKKSDFFIIIKLNYKLARMLPV